MMPFIRSNRWFFGLFAIFVLAGAVLQLLVSPADIFLFINARHYPAADFFFQYVTHLGDGLFFALITVFFLLISYQKALIAFVCFILSSLAAQLLKRFVFADIPRPKAFFEDSTFSLYFIDGVDVHSLHSFPSGHTTTAFALFCLLSIFFRQSYWGIVWFTMALLVAYSRVYLAQHFFWDVYAGAFMGVTITVLVYTQLDARYRKGQMKWASGSLRDVSRRKRGGKIPASGEQSLESHSG